MELYPVALGLYGHWLAETRSENPGVIIDEYMEHVRNHMFISRISWPVIYSVVSAHIPLNFWKHKPVKSVHCGYLLSVPPVSENYKRFDQTYRLRY